MQTFYGKGKDKVRDKDWPHKNIKMHVILINH